MGGGEGGGVLEDDQSSRIKLVLFFSLKCHLCVCVCRITDGREELIFHVVKKMVCSAPFPYLLVLGQTQKVKTFFSLFMEVLINLLCRSVRISKVSSMSLLQHHVSSLLGLLHLLLLLLLHLLLMLLHLLLVLLLRLLFLAFVVLLDLVEHLQQLQLLCHLLPSSSHPSSSSSSSSSSGRVLLLLHLLGAAGFCGSGGRLVLSSRFRRRHLGSLDLVLVCSAAGLEGVEPEGKTGACAKYLNNQFLINDPPTSRCPRPSRGRRSSPAWASSGCRCSPGSSKNYVHINKRQWK